MNRQHLVSILLVSADQALGFHVITRTTTTPVDDFVSVVETARDAIGLLSMITVDLVMIDRILPDMTAWDLARTLRSARPWQLWALVGSELSADDEVRARSLGATGVFDGRPTRPMLSEIAGSLRRRRATLPKRARAAAITQTTR